MSNIIILRSSNGLSVSGLRGKDPPVITGGYGGWNIVARPKRVGSTQWDGKDPLKMDLPILFDGWPYSSVEESCSTLEAMAGLLAGTTPGSDSNLPPVITSIAGEVPHKNLQWVIEDLTWDTQDTIYRPGGRVRQAVIIHMVQKVDDAIITENLHSQPGVPSVYVWKKGDNLQQVASRFYGDPNQWQTIADYNNIRDPSNIAPGTKINLP